jgi:AcrR family transcriptional regulator
MNERAKGAKFKQIIETARELFIRHGIKRVSVEEICKTANVSKMTFYKYFKNKVDLAKSVIKQIVSDAEAEYRFIMNQEIPFSEKVKQMIEMKIDQTDGLSRESLGEFLNSAEPEIAEFLNRVRRDMFQLVLNDLVQVQKEGGIRKDLKPEFILYFLNLMPEMASDEKLVELYVSPQGLIVELSNFFFYGILPKEQANER